MYILVAYPEHPHGMRDANIPLYIPGISLGWRVLVGLIGETTDVGYGSLLPILFLSHLVDSTILLMDLSLVDAWLYFPGLKVGQIYLCSSF
jgi:hypothetical protein